MKKRNEAAGKKGTGKASGDVGGSVKGTGKASGTVGGSVKKAGKRSSAGMRWEFASTLADACGCDLQEYYQMWISAAERVDEALRMKASEEWHRTEEAEKFRNMAVFARRAEAMVAAMKRGDWSDRTACGIGREELTALLEADYVISYSGCHLYDYEQFDYTDDDGSDLDDDERRERIAEDEGLVNLPELPIEDVERFAAANTFRDLKDDAAFARLVAEIERCRDRREICCNQRMRLRENDHYRRFLTLAGRLFRGCAAKAKELGERELGRRLVDAANSAATMDSLVSGAERYDVEKVVRGFCEDVDELFAAVQLEALGSFDEVIREIDAEGDDE